MKQDETEWYPSVEQASFIKMLLNPRGPKTIVSLSRAVGVPRSRIYRNWFNDTNFIAYLRECRDRIAKVWTPAIDQSLLKKALSGDVPAMKLWYERFDDLIARIEANITTEDSIDRELRELFEREGKKKSGTVAQDQTEVELRDSED